MNATLNGCPFPLSRPARSPLAILLWVAAVLVAGLFCAAADARDKRVYADQHLRGTWVWSGLLRFGAPIPVPGMVVDGAPPHALVNPEDLVGVWASTVGLMTFDGRGAVHAEQVVKVGEIALPPGLPFEALPPFPEFYRGSYQVAANGIVQIELSGHDTPDADADPDFEYDLHCVLNMWPREMTCVPARFKTYVVDADGYPAPITGLVELERQR